MTYIAWSHGTDDWLWDTGTRRWYQVYRSTEGQSGAARIAAANDPDRAKYVLRTGSDATVCTPMAYPGPDAAVGSTTTLRYVPRGYTPGEGPTSYFGSHCDSVEFVRWGKVLSDAAIRYGLRLVWNLQRQTDPGPPPSYVHVLSGHALGTYDPSSDDLDRVWVHAD